jgi:DNA recombination protein RmuC
MDPVILLTAALALLAGLAVGVLVCTLLSRRDGAAGIAGFDASLQAATSAVAPVKDSLDRFDSRLRELEATGIAWQERLAAQVEAVRLTGEGLRRETSSLATALRRPHVRGQWGEMHLRRTVELAGMVAHCDFTLQTSARTDDGLLRPDLVVRLAGNRQVVVDAKVPLDAFLRANDAHADGDADGHAEHLAQHARQVRAHVDALSAKAYWRQFSPAPEFVVMFLPGEAFLSHALDADPSLLEYAATRRVVPATPTTLIALLRTVSYAWTQESLADSAREVHDVARELYDRLGSLGGHVDKLGRSLTTAVDSYNRAVGALENRVLVSARRLGDSEVGGAGLAAPQTVSASVRPLAAPELLDGREVLEHPLSPADELEDELRRRGDVDGPPDRASARRTG